MVFTAPTLQVLWSSKVKFISLSRLSGGSLLFGSNSDLFGAPAFIVSPVGKGEKKREKKKKGRKEKEIEKERKEEGMKKRRTERKKELKK